ncbi:MAG: hypothetical protein LBR75_01445 [Prevotellaceae bacterium]|jgi:hypothetical protein|nr:hypothetical protein [Prevotellaceae bacterium]
MSKDYIPATQARFFVWQSDFYNRVNEKLNSFKIDAEKLKAVTAAKSKYELAFSRASNVDTANRADRVERDERAADYKAAIRLFVNENIRFNGNISDYDRQYLGLTVADKTPTPATIPATRPVLTVDFSEPQKHVLHIRDSASSKKTKPAGVMHCEIWRKQGGEMPQSDSELAFAGSSTKSTFSVIYDSALAGTRVYYKARWVNTRSEPGNFGVLTAAVRA